MNTLEDYDFFLPEELIAQYPPEKRGASRLMIVDRNNGSTDTQFSSLGKYLRDGDLLVMNDAKVVNARVYFTRQSGAEVECVLAATDEYPCRVMCNKTKKLRIGEVLISSKEPSVSVTVLGRSGEYLLVEPSENFDESCLERIGQIPLPPYIKRKAENDDSERYQTIYASKSGSVAAPTAGLHFTDELMRELTLKGVMCTYLTLNVSWGTFAPVRNNDLSLHQMHEEAYEISAETAESINDARRDGRRIVAVGTTAVRVLESCYQKGSIIAGNGKTAIFIRPPMRIKSIDALITNFHTPKSTLLMLVSSFAGYERIRAAYEDAVAKKYRFFSYGDAMLIV